MPADTERCPDCDAPLATTTASPSGDINLCWRGAIARNRCARPPAPWRARALAAEADVTRLTGELRVERGHVRAMPGLPLREVQRALDEARTQAAAEAARAERLATALQPFGGEGERWRGSGGYFVFGYLTLPNVLLVRAFDALALTPTVALAEHDAALLARVQPVIEALRVALPMAKGMITEAEAALAAYDKND